MFNVFALAHRYLAMLREVQMCVCDTSYPNPAAVVLLWSDFSEPNLEFENVQYERSPTIRSKPCELLSVIASMLHFIFIH